MPNKSNKIKSRLSNLTPEQAYELGRKDGRAEIQEALNAASDYDMSVEDFLTK